MTEKRRNVMLQMNCGKGFIMKQYNVFVTDQRLIFSILTKHDKKETQRLLNEKVKGKSFKERLSIIAAHGYELPDRYDDMTLEDILSEHQENFQIPYEDIIKINIKRPKTKDSQGYHKDDYIVIRTNALKLKVSPVSKSVLKDLQDIIGNQVKVPFIVL